MHSRLEIEGGVTSFAEATIFFLLLLNLPNDSFILLSLSCWSVFYPTISDFSFEAVSG
jgi:hypothetical protein